MDAPRYREVGPDRLPAVLRDLVECAWQASVPTGVSGDHHQRVLPDGCMDLLLVADRLVVAGPDTAAHTATSAPGSATTGLRFRPGALPALLGVPADALRDRRVDLADVLGRHAALRAETCVTVHSGPEDDRGARLGAGCPLLDAWGAPGVVGPGSAQSLLVTAAHLAATAQDRRRPLPGPVPRRALGALAGGATAADVADRLGVTTRTLHRTCLATLGYGPSVARRVLRFRVAAALLHAGHAPADVAARAGYADQPHLSREVRALAGVSPTVLARPVGTSQM